MDPIITNIHSRRNQPPLSLMMANVVYLIRGTSGITLRNLLKQDLNHSFIEYLIRSIFADFCCREGISSLNSDINDFRDRSAYGSPLNMVARERNSNENNAHFKYKLLNFSPCAKRPRKSTKFSWKFLTKCFYLLRDGVLLFSQIFETKSIQDGVKT